LNNINFLWLILQVLIMIILRRITINLHVYVSGRIRVIVKGNLLQSLSLDG